MTKVRNEKKRKTILPMMIPGRYAAFSKKLFNKKSGDCGEFPHKHRIFYSFFSWLFRQGFFEERHAACSASERLGRAPSALEEARFVKRKPAAIAVNGATVTSPKLPTTVSKISAATYL